MIMSNKSIDGGLRRGISRISPVPWSPSSAAECDTVSSSKKRGQAGAAEREGTRHSSLFAAQCGDPRDRRGDGGGRTQSVKGPNLRPNHTHCICPPCNSASAASGCKRSTTVTTTTANAPCQWPIWLPKKATNKIGLIVCNQHKPGLVKNAFSWIELYPLPAISYCSTVAFLLITMPGISLCTSKNSDILINCISYCRTTVAFLFYCNACHFILYCIEQFLSIAFHIVEERSGIPGEIGSQGGERHLLCCLLASV